jgi:cell wall-associated NlpC family hydrolase
MTPNGTVALVVLAGPLGLILLIVILLGGGASSGFAQLQLAAETGPTVPLNTSAVPNSSWVPWIEQAGSLCPLITPQVIAAQDSVESSWNANAVSPVGAEGIAQFMPGTWPAYDSPPAVPGPDTPFNVADAIMAQGRLDCSLAAAVASLAQQTGIPALTLALDAYNAGLGAVTQSGGVPDNPETEGYAPAIEQLASTTYADIGPSPDGTGPSGSGPSGSGPSGTGTSNFAMAEIAAAEAELGLPYVWGGGSDSGPSGSAVAPPALVGQPGFDCSGLVMYAVYQASDGAIALPHLSQEQVTLGQQVAVATGAQVLASGSLEAGDVIGFYNLDADNQWDHIGIYIGNGEMIDAPETGQVVSVTNLATSYWASVDWDVRSFG